MPSEFTHAIVGLHVIHKLNMLNNKTIKIAALGSQGPDVFLYMPFEKNIHFYGKLLHDEKLIPKFIKTLGEELRSTYPEFAITFASHYILDAILHPYINARTINSLEHGQFERAIDRAYLEYLGISFIGQKITTIMPDIVPHQIEIAIKNSINMLEPREKFFAGYYTVAYKYMMLLHKLYDNMPAIVESVANIMKFFNIDTLCQVIRTKPFKDPLNISRKDWTSEGKIHHEDIIYLIRMAIDISIKVGRTYINGSPLNIESIN